MIIEVKESQIKEISIFLMENKVIFHPNISPDGIPDFSNYKNRRYIVVLDRNILVTMLRLVERGELKDSHKLKLISSLLFWSEFNGISITSGFALMEHAHFKEDTIESSYQHNIFKNMFKQYSPQTWLDLALGNLTEIPIIDNNQSENSNYLVNNEHHTWNYLQTLKMCQLYFQPDLTLVEKLKEFHKWSFENVLIGMYSTCYALLFFSSKTKLSNQIRKLTPQNLLRKCSNVAWDLTYISFWSTLFWDDRTSEEVFLFATMDKEIKCIISLIHPSSENHFTKILGKNIGDEVSSDLKSIYKERPKRTFDPEKLNKLKNQEEDKLIQLCKNYAL